MAGVQWQRPCLGSWGCSPGKGALPSPAPPAQTPKPLGGGDWGRYLVPPPLCNVTGPPELRGQGTAPDPRPPATEDQSAFSTVSWGPGSLEALTLVMLQHVGRWGVPCSLSLLLRIRKGDSVLPEAPHGPRVPWMGDDSGTGGARLLFSRVQGCYEEDTKTAEPPWPPAACQGASRPSRALAPQGTCF